LQKLKGGINVDQPPAQEAGGECALPPVTLLGRVKYGTPAEVPTYKYCVSQESGAAE